DRRGSAFRASFSTSMLCDLQYMRKKYVDPNNKEAGILMGTRGVVSTRFETTPSPLTDYLDHGLICFVSLTALTVHPD
ncbi:MAG: hypothetical protein OXE59_01480, partial [Bacteroidetes bacterium]|nr:hypothetical protein [Bacteroidota bacterium]